MRNSTGKIYLKQWLRIKPYHKQTATDAYYLNLCNQVKEAIFAETTSLVIRIYMDLEEIDLLACFLSSYFEDKISETNIWNTFVQMHASLYKKPIPFYDTQDYEESEINTQDVEFLIWYFINTIQDEKFISPVNEFIHQTAENVMEVFDAAWEYAPENKILKTYYTIDEHQPDFYTARRLVLDVFYSTWLFNTDTVKEVAHAEVEFMKDQEDSEGLEYYINELRDYSIHSMHTRLLGLKAKDWVAEILGENHPLYHEYLNMSPKVRGFFLYKGLDKKDIFLEHIASGKLFKLCRKSFSQPVELLQGGDILYLGMVRWRGEWWFSGIFSKRAYNESFMVAERNSTEAKKSVNFLDPQEDMVKIVKEQFTAFLEFTGGKQVVFLSVDDMKDFLNIFLEFFGAFLRKSGKDKKKIQKRAESILKDKNKNDDLSGESENGLVFFNPKSGPELVFNCNSAFPSPDNPFYDPQKSKDDLLDMLMMEEISPEIANYCIDHFKDELPFLQNEEWKMYLNHLDFLLRFWKKGNYFSKPELTLTGQNVKN